MKLVRASSLFIASALVAATVTAPVTPAAASIPGAIELAPSLQACNPPSTSRGVTGSGGTVVTLYELVSKTCYPVWMRNARNQVAAIGECAGWSGISGWVAGLLGATVAGNIALGAAITCQAVTTSGNFSLNAIDSAAQRCFANGANGIQLVDTYTSRYETTRQVQCIFANGRVDSKTVATYKNSLGSFVKGNTKNRYEKTSSGWVAISGSSRKSVSMGGWPQPVKVNHFLSR